MGTINAQEETEKHKYEVVKSLELFEIRKYEPALFSSVELKSDNFREGNGEGFRILAGYIFGNNITNEKIAMTAPVVMEMGDNYKMMFMVPKDYDLKNLPKPNDQSIIFEQWDEKTFAAIRFDGWATNEKIEKYKQILLEELQKANYKHNNNFMFLGYNAPYERTNRRNEVVVELIDYK
jgi:hypothetical protein